MAPGVKKSFAKNLQKEIGAYCEALISMNSEEDESDLIDKIAEILKKDDRVNGIPLYEGGICPKETLKQLTAVVSGVFKRVKHYELIDKVTDNSLLMVYKRAYTDTDKDTYQAMEGFIHNLNTMHCLPASECVWVKENDEIKLISMKELDKTFAPNKYQVISMNPLTGKPEWKYVIASKKQDNNREIVEVVSEVGQKVKVTSNHKISTMVDTDIDFVYPHQATNILSLSSFAETHDIAQLDNAFCVDIKEKNISNSGEEYVYDISVEDYENFMTEDCLFVHNSRAGAQVPFTSVNYGTDTSPEGRMVMRNLLLSTEAGLGDGETPIFPIQIFKVKEGVNFNEGEPNYDLLRLSCRVTSQRLFPNFSFIDAPFNLQYYKEGHPETECAYMGCRTRVIANVCGDPVVTGRGNLSFTSINLPRLAILAREKFPDDEEARIKDFYKRLDKMLVLCRDQLLERFAIQGTATKQNFDFLMGQGIWVDSDTLGENEPLERVIRQGSLTIGFIGLAETLKELIGEHHGESDRAEELGIDIIRHMREYTDEEAQKYKLNFGIIATPAEGLSGRFVKMDRERFGVIEGVTDKDWYTNSMHKIQCAVA